MISISSSRLRTHHGKKENTQNLILFQTAHYQQTVLSAVTPQHSSATGDGAERAQIKSFHGPHSAYGPYV